MRQSNNLPSSETSIHSEEPANISSPGLRSRDYRKQNQVATKVCLHTVELMTWFTSFRNCGRTLGARQLMEIAPAGH